MLLVMLINLYAVRVLLSRLGEIDYGIFFSVAGVVTTLTCLTTVLAVSTQRFYSYIQGTGHTDQLRSVFSASININLFFSALILVVFEAAGLYFLNAYLDIPADRLPAANLLYHFSVFTFVLTLLQIPYTAAFIANEEMGKYAAISTAECLLKFLVALSIGYISIDRLAYYGMGLLAVAVLVFLSYAYYARKHYAECHYTLVKEKKLYIQLFSFSGWTLFGSLASVGVFQGNTILLNLFFGPIVNTAFGIALQINNAFNTFCNSIVLAIRPAMTRSYAEHDYEYLNRLFFISSKAILYLMLLIAIPLFAYMPFVLDLWLDKVTPNMILFSRLIIVYIVLMTLHHPITIILYAAGKVKQYHLLTETFTLMSFPITWVLFRMGLPSWAAFVSMIGLCMVAHLVRIFCLKRYYGMISIRQYLTSVLMPAMFIAIAMGLFSLLLRVCLPDTLASNLAGMGVTSLLCLVPIWRFALDKSDKSVLFSLIKSKLKRHV